MRGTESLVVAALALAASGCAPLPAWQRGAFARPAMRAQPIGGELEQRYEAELCEARTGGSSSGAAPSGGCACAR